MDLPDEGVLDVDLLADDGSDEECEAPPSSGIDVLHWIYH